MRTVGDQTEVLVGAALDAWVGVLLHRLKHAAFVSRAAVAMGMATAMGGEQGHRKVVKRSPARVEVSASAESFRGWQQLRL